MMFPPCVRDSGNSEHLRTIVAKIDAPNAAAMNWLSSTIGAGRDAQATALVQLECDTDTNIYYVVLTLPHQVTLHHINRDLRKKLEAPPMSATVTWIRPFDRRAQRLFDWGDVWAPREYLERLIEENETSELTKCFPMLAPTIARGDTDHLSLMADATMDTKYCLPCLEEDDVPLPKELTGQTDKRSWMRLQHELKSQHIFGEPGKNWECTVCNEFRAARCVCGAQRCHHHQTITVAPRHRTMWKQSEFTPGPFYVQDPKWMRNEQKVEFICDELGPETASLKEFADVYVKLFADKLIPQKRRLSCLELYRIYNPGFKVKRECELSPVQLQAFQRVFDPNALPRCHWCNSQIPLKLGHVYCNRACAEAANPVAKCSKCPSQDFILVQTPGHNKGRLNGMSRCKGCGHTEYCELVCGWGDSKRRTTSAACSSSVPQHWTKRRRA